jgi:beta-lactamase superfamily II metal-dependent hydrolase
VTLAVWVQTGVLAVTGVLVWWYTRETARLRKEMVRQNKLTIRPIVLAEVVQEQRRRLSLRNVGNGCALNVTLSPKTYGSVRGNEVTGRFEPVEYLPAGDQRQVEYFLDIDGTPATPQSQGDVWPASGGKFEISWEDVEGQGYLVAAEMPPSSTGRRHFIVGPVIEVPKV